MKIALIQCPAWGRQNPPLALSLLAGQLRETGKTVHLFDLNNELFNKASDEDKLLWQLNNEGFWLDKDAVSALVGRYDGFIREQIDKILQSGADAVGFSVFNSSKEASHLIASGLKNKRKDLKIVFGGPQCALHMQGQGIIQSDAVDIVVTGEGEAILGELVALFDETKELKACRGILFKKSRVVVKCDDRAPIENLDKLAFADFHDFDLCSYAEPQRLPIYMSRGCINKCVYCNENLFWGPYRQRSGKRVFEEMQFQSSRHQEVRHFDFVDSLVNANLKELASMADLIVCNNLKITWAGQAIINPHMSYDVLKKLKESGCICLAYGIESGSQKVLDLMGKKFLIEDAQRVIRDTHRVGIHAVTNFMFGFPGEEEEDFRQTLDFVSRNKEFIASINPSPAFTAIGVGTYLYNHMHEYNLDLTGGHLLWKSKDGKNTYETRKRRYQDFCRHVASLGIKFNYPIEIDCA